MLRKDKTPALLENILLIETFSKQSKVRCTMSVSRDEEIQMYDIAVQFDQSSCSGKDGYDIFYMKLKCFWISVSFTVCVSKFGVFLNNT